MPKTDCEAGCSARIDIHKLHHWVALAQPSARLVYGHGWYAKDLVSEAVHQKLNALQEMGYLNLVQGARDARGRDYLAIRTARPWPKGAMPKPIIPENEATRQASALFSDMGREN